MSSKIEVDRDALLAAANQLSNWGKTVMAAPLWEVLAAPVVERQPDAFRFKWDYDHGNGWSRGAIRYVETMEEVEHEDKSTWREITALYTAPPELAELQAPTNGALIKDLTEVIAQQAAEIERLKGGQGEIAGYASPTSRGYGSWLFPTEQSAKSHMQTALSGGPMKADIIPLYTSPPAPVSVLLDEREEFERNYLAEALERDGDEYVRMAVRMAWEGWQARACLDKVKELNQCAP